MNSNFDDKEINDIARYIVSRLFKAQGHKITTIFLCGADKKDLVKGRSKMAALFAEYPRFELLYPEDIFDDLLAGQGQHSLLELENILADSVDVIVLLPESPGSFAELGAFSNNTSLAKKLIVVCDKKFQGKKSFINYGPNRLVKSSKTGKVLFLNYEELSDQEKKYKHYRKINEHISNIKKSHPTEKSVANIIEAEHFIMPCIYLIDEIDNINLYKIMESASKKDKLLCEVATKSALARLIIKRMITRTPKGYSITEIGEKHLRSNFNQKSLDAARCELLNTINRRNARFSYDRVAKSAHL